MVLLILYIIGIIYGLFIVFLFFNPLITINSAILSAFGIMISAFIASFSVRESIANTNRLEEEKIKRELFSRRRKIIYLLGELFAKCVSAHNTNDLIIKKKFLKKCQNSIADGQYIFEKSDYLIIEKFNTHISSLIQLSFQLKDIERIDISNKEVEKDKILRKIGQTQYKLLESLHENLKYIDGSIQLTK